MSVHAPELYRPKIKWRTPERDKYFYENRDVDLITLADNLRMSHRFVLTYLQKLGLRPIGRPKPTYRWGANPKGGRNAQDQV